MTPTQQRLVNINVAWCDYEDNMGENAALEVACQEEGVTSQWFYDNVPDHIEVLNVECQKIWDARKTRVKK